MAARVARLRAAEEVRQPLKDVKNWEMKAPQGARSRAGRRPQGELASKFELYSPHYERFGVGLQAFRGGLWNPRLTNSKPSARNWIPSSIRRHSAAPAIWPKP